VQCSHIFSVSSNICEYCCAINTLLSLLSITLTDFIDDNPNGLHYILLVKFVVDKVSYADSQDVKMKQNHSPTVSEMSILLSCIFIIL